MRYVNQRLDLRPQSCANADLAQRLKVLSLHSLDCDLIFAEARSSQMMFSSASIISEGPPSSCGNSVADQTAWAGSALIRRELFDEGEHFLRVGLPNYLP
jgi:hypothetical protein